MKTIILKLVKDYILKTLVGLHQHSISHYIKTLTSKAQTTSPNGLAVPDSEIEVVVNKDLLYKLIKEAEAFNEDEFTSDSYKVYQLL